MEKPTIFGNNCQIEIIPLIFLSSFNRDEVKVNLILKEDKNSFLIDAVTNSIRPSTINESPPAGDIYKVTLSFRIAYQNSKTSELLNLLKTYNRLLVTYVSPGGERIVLGTDEYPVFLTYNNPTNFDGYEVNLSGTQDIPPLFKQD